MSGAEHPQGQPPSSALRAPSHSRCRFWTIQGVCSCSLSLTWLSALRRVCFRISSESAFSPPIAASPGDPLPLEVSSRRRFPPAPLLRFDVNGVVADVTGSAAPASGLKTSFGLGCQFARKDFGTAVRANGGCVVFEVS